MEEYKKEFIEFMVRSGVLTFGDFTTKSGRKTPFFINTGNYKTGEQIARLGEYYAQAIVENYPIDKIQVLFGPAYKGIPLIITSSIALTNIHKKSVSFCFNRKEAKTHGEKGAIIGHKLQDGDNILIVEDVTTAGTSIRETVPLLKEKANVNIVGLIVSVDRMEKSGNSDKNALVELSQEFTMQTGSIVSIEEIVEYLHNREIDGKVLIDGVMKTSIENYREKYGASN